MIMEVKHFGGKMLLGAAVVMVTLATSALCQGGPSGPGGAAGGPGGGAGGPGGAAGGPGGGAGGPGGQMSAADQAKAAANKSVVAGDCLIVEKTTNLESLNLAEGSCVAAPAGKSLTMTVDGVQKEILPGKYSGKIVLTVTDEYAVGFQGSTTHHFRQALYLDASGVNASKSAVSAAGDFKVSDHVLTGADIKSEGKNFNGIVATGGTWTVKNLKLNFEGDGGNDFAGFGAAILSDGKDATLIVDNAEITTHGVVRTAAVGNNGSHLIVKNSKLMVREGVLPKDYVSNVSPGQMFDAPWMLGVKGAARATNVLGDNTYCSYINDDVKSNSWGVLSVDSSQNIFLTVINSKIAITGESGYGTYAIGSSTNQFYGSTIDTPDYGFIITGGNAILAASSKENLAKLNADRKLLLTDAELASLPEQQTVVNAGRADFMIWGDNTIKISDASQVNSDGVIFLDKAAKGVIDVDGSKGAKLNTKKGVIMQMINSDDPGPVMTNGTMANTGVYKDPTDVPAKAKDFDLSAAHKTDLVANFKSIELNGDFYNAVRSYTVGAAMGNDSASKEAHDTGMNMVLNFDKSKLTGVISSATAKHMKSELSAPDYKLMGVVTNTPSSAINNGAVVTLNNSTWTVTGNSYLTALTIGKGSTVAAPAGQKLAMKVNGKVTPVKAGAYKGDIVIELAK
jgi:hypothetical protein